MHGVVSCEEEADTKRTQTTVLRVALLQVADPLHELLDGHVLVEGGEMRLCSVPAVVDEGGGIGSVARYGGHDVSAGRSEPSGAIAKDTQNSRKEVESQLRFTYGMQPAHSFIAKTFSSGPPPALSSNLLVTFFSAARTTPCLFFVFGLSELSAAAVAVEDDASLDALVLASACVSAIATSPSPGAVVLAAALASGTAIESSFFSACKCVCRCRSDLGMSHDQPRSPTTRDRETDSSELLAKLRASLSRRQDTDHAAGVRY